MATTKTTKPTTPKVRTCTWKVDGEKRCGEPTLRPTAVTCRKHVEAWYAAHPNRKMTAFSTMTEAEIAKAKAARPKPATSAPARKAPKPTARKVVAKTPSKVADAVDPMERELAAVKAMKEAIAEK